MHYTITKVWANAGFTGNCVLKTSGNPISDCNKSILGINTVLPSADPVSTWGSVNSQEPRIIFYIK